MIELKKTSFFDNFDRTREIFPEKRNWILYMQGIEVQLNNCRYIRKPEGKEFAVINKKITKELYELSMNEFAKACRM